LHQSVASPLPLMACGARQNGKNMSDDFAEMDDSTLISRRQEIRAQLEQLPPHSADHGELQAIYDQSTEVINERARAAWTAGPAMPDKNTARTRLWLLRGQLLPKRKLPA
jgi:hypothetical protein